MKILGKWATFSGIFGICLVCWGALMEILGKGATLARNFWYLSCFWWYPDEKGAIFTITRIFGVCLVCWGTLMKIPGKGATLATIFCV